MSDVKTVDASSETHKPSGEKSTGTSQLSLLEKIQQLKESNKQIVIEYNPKRMKTVEEMHNELKEFEVDVIRVEPTPDRNDLVTSFFTFATWLVSVNLIFFIARSAVTSVGQGILTYIGILLVLIGLTQFALLAKTNASSISGMVAQRWKPVSYIAILMMVTFGISVAALLICIAIVQDKANNGHPLILKSVFMPLSIFLCLSILMAPLPVDKLPYQLEMVPLTDSQRTSKELSFKNDKQEDKLSYAYQLTFLNYSPETLHNGHYFAIGLGYIIGLISEIIQIQSYLSNPTCGGFSQDMITVLTVAYMIWAGFNAVCFLTAGGYIHMKNHAIMACEITFLLSHFVSMILFLVNTEGLIEIK